MRSERTKVKEGLRIVGASAAIALGLLFSLGVMGRPAASSRGSSGAVIAPVANTEASAATAQADSGSEISEMRLAGHSELDLQPD